MIWQLAGGGDGISIVSAVLGLATSLLLIVTGRDDRRHLPPED